MLTIDYNAHVCRLQCSPDVARSVQSILGQLTATLEASTATGLQKGGFPLTYREGIVSFYNNLQEDIFTIPTGLLPRIIPHIVRRDITYNMRDYPRRPALGELHEGLWAHQRRLVSAAIEHQRCTLSSPTGSGKSVVIGEYIRQLGGNTLVTVPTINLMHQTHAGLEKYLGVPIGRLGDNHKDIKTITVALPGSLQSYMKKDEGEDWLSQIETWVIDECHNISPGYALLSEAMGRTYARLGVSATVWKGQRGVYLNGGQLLIEAICGPLVQTITEADMIAEGVILAPQVHYYTAPSISLPPSLQGEYSDWKYNQCYNRAIVGNLKRNQLAARLASEYIQDRERGGPLAIIVKRVNTSPTKGKAPGPSHAEIIQTLLRERGVELPIIHGKTGSREMQAIFNLLRSNELPGVISGPGVFKEGVDIPNLGGVMLLAAGSSDSELIQRIGRALRQSPGKSTPRIIDFIDQVSWFAGQSQKRMELIRGVYGECLTIHNA